MNPFDLIGWALAFTASVVIVGFGIAMLVMLVGTARNQIRK